MTLISVCRYLFLIFLGLSVCLVPRYVFAQKNNPTNTLKKKPVVAFVDTAVIKLFDKGAKLEWQRFFRGRLDDVSEITLSLGFDGSQCRGYMTYVASGERFKLSGSLDGAVLVLDETDTKGLTSGHITGTMQGDRIDAEWTNAANTVGSHLGAAEAESAEGVGQTCGENKWVGRYVARWNNARVDFTLARVNNGLLNGYLWIEADDKTYALSGKIFNDEKYEMKAILPNGKIAAQLHGVMADQKTMDLNWVGSGEKRTIKMIQRHKLSVECLEYADYNSSYDALYPSTNCATCNESLGQIVTEWVKACEAKIAAGEKRKKPAFRNIQRASAWYEITCWTETIFCGYLTFAESWKDQTTGHSFNYDLRTGKEIVYEDLFNRSFKPQEWFAEYARKESPKMAKFAADPKFREWLQKDGFPMFTIRRDGLELSTRFHPTYGQYHLTVPYNILKPYMRRDNPIKDLVK